MKSKPYLQYHKGGTLCAEGETTGDLATGYWQWFRPDGTLKRSGYFREGIQVGQWTTYDKTGAVYKVTDLKDGDPMQQKTVIT